MDGDHRRQAHRRDLRREHREQGGAVVSMAFWTEVEEKVGESERVESLMGLCECHAVFLCQ